MNSLPALFRGSCCRPSVAVVLVLFFSTSTTEAEWFAGSRSVTAPQPGAAIQAVGSFSNSSTQASEDVGKPPVFLGLMYNIADPFAFGAILGDRQRMVQVALVCMGIAILILTRGNRF
jgi:hypothetical protein